MSKVTNFGIPFFFPPKRGNQQPQSCVIIHICNTIVMKRRFCCWIYAALTLALGGSATSCIYDGEGWCPDNLSFTINTDWTDAPDASPEGMAYIFFPNDGSELWRFDFPGRTGGNVSMLRGCYRFLSYNDDTYNVLFRGEKNYDTYEAYTSDTDLLGGIPLAQWGEQRPFDPGESVTLSPDMMWGCAYCSFSLDYCGVRYNTSPVSPAEVNNVFSPQNILTVKQHPITAYYTYRIENVENLAGVKSMSAALSGMAGSIFLASGRQGSYPSTISVKATICDSTTIAGNFYTFGIPQTPETDNILSLFVVIKDGRRFCYRFDVTDQIRSAPDPMNVNILLRGLTLELPDHDDGTGFEVNVDGWETIIVNIKG